MSATASVCLPLPFGRNLSVILHFRSLAEKVVEKLTSAILDLVELYCSTFNANFHTTPHSYRHTAPIQEVGMVTNVLSFSIYSAHRIPITWATRYLPNTIFPSHLSRVHGLCSHLQCHLKCHGLSIIYLCFG